MLAKNKRPVIVTIIIIVNIFGWLTTEGVWLYLHLTGQIPPISAEMSYFERAYVGLVNGFTVADAIWSNLTLLFSIIGLWKMRNWGWLATFMANTIWMYTMTFTLIRDLMTQITAGTLFFLGFAAFAIFSSIVLWQKRFLFWEKVRQQESAGN